MVAILEWAHLAFFRIADVIYKHSFVIRYMGSIEIEDVISVKAIASRW